MTYIATLPRKAQLPDNILPAPLDQGQTGDCTAYALATALLTERKAAGLPDVTFDPVAFYALEAKQPAFPSLVGAITTILADGFPVVGGVAEKLNGVDFVPYGTSAPHYVDAIKQAIAQGFGVLVSINVGLSFEGQEVTQKGIWQPQWGHEVWLQQHEILIVGYDEDYLGGMFYCQSTYGAQWGLGGRVWIPMYPPAGHRELITSAVVPYVDSKRVVWSAPSVTSTKPVAVATKTAQLTPLVHRDVLAGKQMWVWELTAGGATAAQIAQDAKAMGIDGVIVKCADGTTPWPQFAESLATFRAAGLIVAAWAYIYPQNLRTQATVIADAERGADYLVIDAETEWEIPNAAALVITFMTELKKRIEPGHLVGLTTFAEPRLHPQFPYAAFVPHVDFLAPQVYWAAAGMSPAAMIDNSLNGLAGYKKRIVPVGQAYPTATPAEVALFTAHAVERKLTGISWWSAQSMTPAIKDAITHAVVYQPTQVIHSSTTHASLSVDNPVQNSSHGLDAKQTATVAEIEKLAEELKSE